jgi:hypothetical protein
MINYKKLSYIKGAEINVPDTSIYEYLLMRVPQKSPHSFTLPRGRAVLRD